MMRPPQKYFIVAVAFGLTLPWIACTRALQPLRSDASSDVADAGNLIDTTIGDVDIRPSDIGPDVGQLDVGQLDIVPDMLFSPTAVRFDGTSAWLTSTQIVGAPGATSQVFTGSFWFRRQGGLDKRQTIFRSYFYGNGLSIRFESNNTLRFDGVSTGLAPKLVASSSNSIIDSNWHHVAFSFEPRNSARLHLFIDGRDELCCVTTDNPASPFWVADHDQVRVGADDPGTGLWHGDLAEVWIDFVQYLDFSSETMREAFRTTTHHPVPLGPTGSVATGTSPAIFLSGPSSWESNKGTGGGFTVTGALTPISDGP